MTAENSAREAIRYAVKVAKLPRDGLDIDFVADETQRRALAEQLEIVKVARLSARLVAKPWRAEGVAVQGRLKAEVEQASVVTLEPIGQVIDEPFHVTFVPENSRLARIVRPDETELQIDPEADDPPEIFFGEVIDIGPYLSEAVALALDPYPRESDAAFAPVDTDSSPEAPAPSPFGVLAELKAVSSVKDDTESN